MIIVGGFIFVIIVLLIFQNSKGLMRTIKSKKFGKALYALYGDPNSTPTSNYDLFRMIGPKEYPMSYEVRQTNYDPQIPFRTILKLRVKANQRHLPFCLYVRPKGYDMQFRDAKIRKIEVETEFLFKGGLDYWTDAEVYAQLFLDDAEVLLFFQDLQKKYRTLMFSLEPNAMEIQLAGVFSNHKDLGPIENIMEKMVELWEKAYTIVEES